MQKEIKEQLMEECDIFISYSHKDSKIVERIIKDLSEAGYSIKYDSSMTAGHDWFALAKDYMMSTKCAIFMISNNSLCSMPVYEELNYASERPSVAGYYYFPLLLEGNNIPEIYQRAVERKQYDTPEKMVAEEIMKIFNPNTLFVKHSKNVISDITNNLIRNNINPSNGKGKIIDLKLSEHAKIALENNGDKLLVINDISEAKSSLVFNQNSPADKSYRIDVERKKYDEARAKCLAVLKEHLNQGEVWIDYINCVLEGEMPSQSGHAAEAKRVINDSLGKLEVMKLYDVCDAIIKAFPEFIDDVSVPFSAKNAKSLRILCRLSLARR